MLSHGLIAAAVLMAGAAPAPDRLCFREDLLFYASFDRSADADVARGAGKTVEAKAVRLVDGKVGRAAGFEGKAGTHFCAYPAQGNVRADQGTIAFWFRPGWSGDQAKHRTFFFRPGGRSRGAGANSPDSMAVFTMAYKKPPLELWFWCDDHGGGNNIARCPIDAWRARQWVHVAVTWDERWLQIYQDGRLTARKAMRGRITEPDDRFWVGSSRKGASPSEGVLDELCIYGRALSAGEVGILTGRPEFVAPRVQAVAVLQRLFYTSERCVRFRCELAGRVDPSRYRLYASLRRDGAAGATAGVSLPAVLGPHALEAPAGWSEGGYVLCVELRDRDGRTLDKKDARLHVVRGPFD